MSEHAEPTVPSIPDYYWPTLEALRALGGSATKQEIDARVIEDLHLTPEQLQVLEGNGPHTQVTKRLAWDRTHLAKIGALSSDGQGLWALTDKGSAMRQQDAGAVPAQVRAAYPGAGRLRGRSPRTRIAD